MLKKVKQIIHSYLMIEEENPIIVGVSGGPDSMVLLDVLSRILPNQLIAAHLNHKFRGIEAEEDAKFVERECKKRDIPIEIENFDVPAFMIKTGMGAQEAAREIRYRFYKNVAKKWSAKRIALGHHANDQAETILMRFIRGTGPHGLSGIPYIRDLEEFKVIRPLLDVTREEIEAYCKSNSISYIIDKSNFSTKYFRNEIRLEIIPYLMKYNKKLIAHTHQLGKILQDEDDYLKRETNNFIKENIIESNTNTYKFNSTTLQSLDIALQRRVIHLILSYLNMKQELSFIHVDSALQLIHQSHPSKSIDLPGVRVYRNYEQVVFTTLIDKKANTYKYVVNIPGELNLHNISKKIRTYVTEKYEKPEGIWEVFDFDEIKEKQLVIRSRQDGDRIQIKGMNGSKKVKDLYIDLKISKELRNIQPIIETDEKILWIPGIKRSRHALISNKTKYFFYVVVD